MTNGHVMSINYSNNTNGVYDYDKCVSASRFVTCRCLWGQPLGNRALSHHCHCHLSCQPSPFRSGHQSVTPHSVMSRSTSPRTTYNTVRQGSVSLVTLMSFLHGHYVACLATGYLCSFDINLTCYFSSVMRNVTTLEWIFSVVFSAICFAGALGLICQHGGQGVNDCGNDICM